MGKKAPFDIQLEPAVTDHFEWIDVKYHSLILDGIDEQLAFEPMVETRNRKPLADPGIAGCPWELRLGPGNRFRVFYRVYSEERVVVVAALGVKRKNRLMIGGEEV